MSTYYAVYKKENMLQCRFSNNFIHPDYIGAEFPIGQHLINAVVCDRPHIEGLYADLIKTYISYLDEATDESFHSYEKVLFKIDDYCIYLHEISNTLLSLIESVHPRYSLNDLIGFIKLFDSDIISEFTNQFAVLKQTTPVKKDEYLTLWNTASRLLLDRFESDIKILKEDIYVVCASSEQLNGLNRLNALDNKRKIFYYDMPFSIQLSSDLGEAANSRFLTSKLSENSDITYSVSLSSTLQLMYYDFISALENDLPIKICKNCKTPFIPKGRIDSVYCDRIMPGFKDKCSAIGAINAYKSKLPDIEADFYAARRRYNTRVSRNPLLKAEFEVWKIKSREKLTSYRNGEISADEFKKWFMDDKWTKS